ncbi:MAG: ABC transporter permease subunit [Candidatus Limnocylindrales bacterium]
MMARAPIAALTLRGLLDRRRTWLMVALAAVPVVLVGLAAGFGDAEIEAESFDALIVRLVLPLIALVFGTAAIGSELEEGTVVYLLTKPVRRARIVASKGAVAAGLTAALIGPAAVLTGIVATLAGDDVVSVGVAYGIASAVGGAAYVMLFLVISTFTSRALAIGLGYVMLWEGVLADLLEGTRVLSVRQGTLAVARQLAGEEPPNGAVGFEQGLFIIVAVVVISGALATWRMSRYQLRGGD